MRLRMSQTAFGQIASVTKMSQINYESGRRSPDAVYLTCIASAGVDVLYVLTGRRAVQGDADLALYADCWLALDAALGQAKKAMVPEKKRETVDALFEMAKQGNGDVASLAEGLAKVAV